MIVLYHSFDYSSPNRTFYSSTLFFYPSFPAYVNCKLLENSFIVKTRCLDCRCRSCFSSIYASVLFIFMLLIPSRDVSLSSGPNNLMSYLTVSSLNSSIFRSSKEFLSTFMQTFVMISISRRSL